MLTNDGYYEQIDGLAMGSPPVPMLANGWVSKYDQTINGNTKLYSRYMDDILRDFIRIDIVNKVDEVNNLHPSLHLLNMKRTAVYCTFLGYTHPKRRWEVDLSMVHKEYRHRSHYEFPFFGTSLNDQWCLEWYIEFYEHVARGRRYTKVCKKQRKFRNRSLFKKQ